MRRNSCDDGNVNSVPKQIWMHSACLSNSSEHRIFLSVTRLGQRMGKHILLNFFHYSFSLKITVLVTMGFDMDK